MNKPLAGIDFPVFFKGYVDQVPYTKHPFSLLQESLSSLKNDVKVLSEVDFSYAYGVGKWTIAQVLRHCIDTERIFSYRSLCIARKESNPIIRFDENGYADTAGVLHDRTLLLEELYTVRKSSALLFNSINESNKDSKGNFENGDTISIISMAYIIVGHWYHHKNILQSRYGVAF